MPRRCTICTHPQREEIDRLIIEGKKPYTEIARLFGVHESAIRRHKKVHLAPKLKKAFERHE